MGKELTLLLNQCPKPKPPKVFKIQKILKLKNWLPWNYSISCSDQTLQKYPKWGGFVYPSQSIFEIKFLEVRKLRAYSNFFSLLKLTGFFSPFLSSQGKLNQFALPIIPASIKFKMMLGNWINVLITVVIRLVKTFGQKKWKGLPLGPGGGNT